jgi:hypothetical protein
MGYEEIKEVIVKCICIEKKKVILFLKIKKNKSTTSPYHFLISFKCSLN